MGWRGISLVAHGSGQKQELIKICPRVGSPSRPTWVNTLSFDKDENGQPTPSWKKIASSPEGLKEVIVKINGLSLIPIDLFKSNGTVVSIKELYNFPGKAYCAFVHNKNISSLLVVGNKTAAEMEACGYTKKSSRHPTQESFAPLIIGVKDNKTVLVNYL
jgi:hypothetical protein